MTDKQHFDTGFNLGIRGRATKRTRPGPKATKAFLYGNKLGLIAAAREYERQSKGY